MRTRFAGATDTGLLREQNEDAFVVLPEHRVTALADGMGGHRSGSVASQLAVATVSDFFRLVVGRDGTWPFPADPTLTDEQNYLAIALRLANRRIFERSTRVPAELGMGTTVVALAFDALAESVAVGHIGDSRCYRLRGGAIEQLTRDHSLVSDARLIAPWMSAAELRQLPTNVVTRALGIRDEVVVDLRQDPTAAGDVYLLCSDGLSGLVSDDRMLELVGEAPSLEVAAQALVDEANERGGTDNITVVLCAVEEAALGASPVSGAG